VYDGDGNKVSETHNGTTTAYLIDTQNLTGYAQVVEELVNGNVVRTYTYGHDLLNQDQRISGTNWSATWFAYDGHGSVRQLTDGVGNVTDHYDYDAFGVLLHSQGTTFNRYRYCGEQYDDALGLYYLRARFMNASNGRFWSMDSYEGEGSDPQSLHKYLYANADPVNGSDPSGNVTLVETEAASTIRANLQKQHARVRIADKIKEREWLITRVELQSGEFFEHTYIWAFNVKSRKGYGYHVMTTPRLMAKSRRAEAFVPSMFLIIPQLKHDHIGSLKLPVASFIPVAILTKKQFVLWNAVVVPLAVFDEVGCVPYRIPDAHCKAWSNTAAYWAAQIQAIPF
jgi:RHS repeat-associated protein